MKKLFKYYRANKTFRYLILVLFIGLIAAAALNGYLGSQAQETTKQVKNFASGGFDINQDNASIDISQLKQGCPVKDCIPSIDNPEFISAKEGDKFLNGEDVVFAINYQGVVKAYPQRILNWHEIVNDFINDKPVVVSFCPLCGTAIAHERILKGQTVEFGVSGKLVQSNLVMYDRLTDTLWQHATGEAIAGELVGEELIQFPLETTTWGQWKEANPDTLVLSTDTGFSRNYDISPYGDYETSQRFLFAPDKTDDRLEPKTIGFGVEIGDNFKFYPDDKIGTSIITDTFAGKTLEIKRDKSGAVTIIDKDSGEKLNSLRGMWFSWFAFNPETELFE